MKKHSTNDLNRQIGLYSLAAAAAGVSLLALAQPAAGEVVVTRKTIPIPISQLGMEGVGISLTNNGVNDLKLILSSFSIFGANGNSLKAVNAAEGEGVLGHNVDRIRYGFALAPGAKIGPSANFVSAACGGSYFSYCGVRLAATHTSTFGSRNVEGPWSGTPKNGYLGIRFLIDGERHYGWVRLTVNTRSPRRTTATVIAYAYETIANQPIVAGNAAGTAAGTAEKPTAEVQLPETITPENIVLESTVLESTVRENLQTQAGPSLGMLALGADGVPVWRRTKL